jgi:hypothetical protein
MTRKEGGLALLFAGYGTSTLHYIEKEEEWNNKTVHEKLQWKEA